MSDDLPRALSEAEIVERALSRVEVAPSRLTEALNAFHPNSLEDAEVPPMKAAHPLAVDDGADDDDDPILRSPGSKKIRRQLTTKSLQSALQTSMASMSRSRTNLSLGDPFQAADAVSKRQSLSSQFWFWVGIRLGAVILAVILTVVICWATWDILNGAVASTILGMFSAVAIGLIGICKLSMYAPARAVRVISVTSIVIPTLLAACFPWLRYDLDGVAVCMGNLEELNIENSGWRVVQYYSCVAATCFVSAIAAACVMADHEPSFSTRSTIHCVVVLWLQGLGATVVFAARWCEGLEDDLNDDIQNWSYKHTAARRMQYYFWGLSGPLGILCVFWITLIKLRRITVLYDNCGVLISAFGQKVSPRELWWLLCGAVFSFACGSVGLYASRIFAHSSWRITSAVLAIIAAVCIVVSLIPGVSFVAFGVRIFSMPIEDLKREINDLHPQTPPHVEATWAIRVLSMERTAVLWTSSTTLVFATMVACLVLNKSWRDNEIALFWMGIFCWAIDLIVNAVGMAILSGVLREHTPPLDAKESMPVEISRGSVDPEDCIDPEQKSIKVEELAGRGVVLESILDFYAKLGADGLMSHFDPLVSTTNDVVRQAVIPMSRDGDQGKSLSSIWNHDEPLFPTCIVTHAWTNIFRDLVAALVAFAIDQKHFQSFLVQLSGATVAERAAAVARIKELLSPEKLSTSFWICIFSVNQHASICAGFGSGPKAGPDTLEYKEWNAKCYDSVTQQKHILCDCKTEKIFNERIECEIDKFDDIMMWLIDHHGETFRQLIAIDSQLELFNRVWCIAELVKADEMRCSQHTVVLNSNIMDMQYGKLISLRADTCRATRTEDRDRILSKIKDKDAFNRRLQWIIFGARGLVRSCGEDQVHDASRIAKRAMQSWAIVDSVDRS
eukprot:TRINITY_DN22753_c0_g1_i1.p1 TRINITY_DN22753_c0_g1~~TRINITY_DN22753_c0_g1_i1.p1  ORF type:complete len:910 (-),score=126.20 TRINITY_DN22753_c0_g1_i1:39-2741(-)